MKVLVDELEDVARRAIQGYGYDEGETETILSVLMYAQLRGNNQGVVKLIGPGIPRNPDARPVCVERETDLSVVLDGGTNHAMVVVSHAVELALDKARRIGVGVVGIHHVNTSSGAIGYYARRLAEHGMIGIVLAGATPTVAAEGSYEPIFGTNPLAIAVPSDHEPVVLDLATAAMAFFGVIEAQTAGRELPPGTAYDERGRPTVDPAEAIGGALRTFDRGPKGSGLSFAVQALTGPLVGGAFAGIGDVETNWGGHLVIALDPDLLLGRHTLSAGVSAIVERVKATKRLDGVDEIFVPGERGDRMTTAARRSGEVEIEDNLYLELQRVSRAAAEQGAS